MEKEFVTYEQALILKELGFNEECFAITHKGGDLNPQIQTVVRKNSELADYIITRPLNQQAFRWFREKHNIQSYVRHECPDGESYYDFVIDEDVYDVMQDTHEEAESACLDKLIEIIKNK